MIYIPRGNLDTIVAWFNFTKLNQAIPKDQFFRQGCRVSICLYKQQSWQTHFLKSMNEFLRSLLIQGKRWFSYFKLTNFIPKINLNKHMDIFLKRIEITISKQILVKKWHQNLNTSANHNSIWFKFQSIKSIKRILKPKFVMNFINMVGQNCFDKEKSLKNLEKHLPLKVHTKWIKMFLFC